MTTIRAKHQQRVGDLADLPVGPNGLLVGELGYAANVNKLFIGNQPQVINSDGALLQYTVLGQDLNSMSAYAWKMFDANDADITQTITSLSDAGNSNTLVEFSTPPATGNLTLYYNTELESYTSDIGNDLSSSTSISPTPDTTPVAINSVVVNTARHDNIELKYSLKNSAAVRTGTLTISVVSPTTAMISDTFNTTATNGEVDHVFSATILNDIMTLHYYTQTETLDTQFSWVFENWQST